MNRLVYGQHSYMSDSYGATASRSTGANWRGPRSTSRLYCPTYSRPPPLLPTPQLEANYGMLKQQPHYSYGRGVNYGYMYDPLPLPLPLPYAPPRSAPPPPPQPPVLPEHWPGWSEVSRPQPLLLSPSREPAPPSLYEPNVRPSRSASKQHEEWSRSRRRALPQRSWHRSGHRFHHRSPQPPRQRQQQRVESKARRGRSRQRSRERSRQRSRQRMHQPQKQRVESEAWRGRPRQRSRQRSQQRRHRDAAEIEISPLRYQLEAVVKGARSFRRESESEEQSNVLQPREKPQKHPISRKEGPAAVSRRHSWGDASRYVWVHPDRRQISFTQPSLEPPVPGTEPPVAGTEESIEEAERTARRCPERLADALSRASEICPYASGSDEIWGSMRVRKKSELSFDTSDFKVVRVFHAKEHLTLPGQVLCNCGLYFASCEQMKQHVKQVEPSMMMQFA